MKHSRVLFTIVPLALIYLFTCAVLTATAAAKKDATPSVDPRKLIKAVDATAGTVDIQYMRDKSIHTYKVDDTTLLKINLSPGKITDIKPGMVVDDFLERDDKTLDGLTLSGHGTEPAKPKTPTKPKPPPKPAPTPTT